MKKKGLIITLSIMIALIIIITAALSALLYKARSEEKKAAESSAVIVETTKETSAAATTPETTKETAVQTTIETTTETETTTEKVYDDPKLQFLSKVKDTDSVILTVGDGGWCSGTLYYYVKEGDEWVCQYETYAVVGENGYSDHTYEGDRTTPTGYFDLGIAFGILDNPGTSLEWVDVNEYQYWIADPEDPNYEKMVDVRDTGYTWNDAEHLIEFYGYYNYCVHIKVNPPYTTSAIFLHCSCGGNYTGGCVGIDEESMVWILRNMTNRTKMAIAQYEEDLLDMIE